MRKVVLCLGLLGWLVDSPAQATYSFPSRLPWGFNIMPILGRYARTQLICPMLFSASAAARLIAVVVFPLPPFPLQIAMRFTRPN